MFILVSVFTSNAALKKKRVDKETKIQFKKKKCDLAKFLIT